MRTCGLTVIDRDESSIKVRNGRVGNERALFSVPSVILADCSGSVAVFEGTDSGLRLLDTVYRVHPSKRAGQRGGRI